LPVWNALEHLLALYTDPESHNAQRYKHETDGRTDTRTDDIIDMTFIVWLKSVKCRH